MSWMVDSKSETTIDASILLFEVERDICVVSKKIYACRQSEIHHNRNTEDCKDGEDTLLMVSCALTFSHGKLIW